MEAGVGLVAPAKAEGRMIGLTFDEKAQAAKSSIDDALGVARRVQQRVAAPAGGVPSAPAPQGLPQPPQPQRPPMAAAPGQFPQPAVPATWPTMPGVNPLLQQLATQYAAQQPQQPQQAPQPRSFARDGLAVFR